MIIIFTSVDTAQSDITELTGQSSVPALFSCHFNTKAIFVFLLLRIWAESFDECRKLLKGLSQRLGPERPLWSDFS